MKILALTSRLPYPLVGGDRLRFHAICREMSKRHRLTLLSLCETRAEMTAKLPDDGVFAAAHRVHLPRWRSWLNCMAALPGARPLQVAYYRSAEFRAQVAALLPAHDAAFAHLIRVAEYLDARDGRPAILDMTDAISMNYARVAAVGAGGGAGGGPGTGTVTGTGSGTHPRHPRVLPRHPRVFPRHPRVLPRHPRVPLSGGGIFRGGFRGLVYRIELPRLLKYERAIAARFDLAVLCSPVDRDFLFPPPAPANVLVCGNGADFARVAFSPPPASPSTSPSSPSPSPAGTAVFIGNMTTLQNRDAAWWFCRQILPLLQRQNPAWEFKIIGPLAAREKARFNRRPGVTAGGAVEDVATEVARTRAAGGMAIGVCPLRAGAGVQNKILDYMALGLPCVTTALGGEGLRARAGEELLVADSAKEFAAAVAGLAADPALARRLSVNARRYIETEHSWAANLAPLMARLEALAPPPVTPAVC